MGELMGRAYFVLLALAVFAVLCASPAFASTCTVHGIVTDANGDPVQGADVTLFDGNRAEITSVTTDASGRFTFNNVNVDTGLCTVRVFYNDLHQTYNNAAYFDVWYTASGDVSVPLKDTRLGLYHKTSSTATSPGSPMSTPSFTYIAAMIALFLVAAGIKKA